MSEAESGQDQFVTVEAPVKIEPGQNLYDQPPFNLVIAHIALTHNLSVEQIKALLAELSKNSDRPGVIEKLNRNNGSGAIFAERTILDLRPYLTSLRMKVDGEELPTGIQSARALLRDLAPYPWWFSYVNKNVDGNFLRDGSWDGNNPQPVDSYAIWAKKRLERDKAAVSIGIEEVFPQDFRTTATSIAVSRGLVSKGVTSLGILKK